MSTEPAAPADIPGGTPPGTDRSRQVRGSALLLAGRFISLGLGFILQIAIVRYLTKADYGAFEYALSIVSLGSTLTALGLDKAMSRFLPIYQEEGQHGKVLGTLALAVVAMGLVGAVVIVAILLLRDVLGTFVDPASVALLGILVVLIPALAAESLATAVFSVLASPRAIFFRRHVLAPALELLVVAIVVVTGASVVALAIGWVLAALFGVGVYLIGLIVILRRRGILTRERLADMQIPTREVLGFSLPLLSTDVVFVLRGSLVVILLGILATTIEVAAFRAVYPQARLILIVLNSFTYLFVPAAARLFARGSYDELSGLQWHSTAWVTLLSFPAFAVSFVLADGITVLLYGAQYATSAPILMILSLGFMVSAALGPAGLTLRALGRVRYLVSVDVATAVAGIVAYLVLVPAFGAMGAAVGTAGTLIVQSLAYQVGAFRNGVRVPDRATLTMAAMLTMTLVGLLAIQVVLQPPLWAGIVIVGSACLGVLRLNRALLDLGGTFPELARIPVIRRLAGVERRP